MCDCVSFSYLLVYLGGGVINPRDMSTETENSLLAAENVWFQCNLYLQFTSHNNLWKKCVNLGLLLKYLVETFFRLLWSKNVRGLILRFIFDLKRAALQILRLGKDCLCKKLFFEATISKFNLQPSLTSIKCLNYQNLMKVASDHIPSRY